MVNNRHSAERVITYSMPVVQESGANTLVSSTIQADGQSFDVWYRVSHGPVANGVESFLAACVVPAMKLGCAIRTPAPISAKLYHGLLQYQQILHRWFPELQVVPIETELRPDVPAERVSQGVGSFFSAGVDACYTFCQHQEELTTCILIHGFDYFHDNSHVRQAVSQMAQQAMQTLGKPLIEVDTNIRSFADRYSNFRFQYHGCILASVALLLTPQLHKVYISSTCTYDSLYPLGTHPETDPLWSSDQVSVIHDGCEAMRWQKTQRIAQSDAILNILRVCISGSHHSADQYNCGKCEKCMRTMMDLRLAGALNRCTTFRNPFSLRRMARTDTRGFIRCYYEQSYAEAVRRQDDPALIRALEVSLSNRQHTGLAGVLHRLKKQMQRHLVRPLIGPMERAVHRMVRR